jgi:hypothetical protein
MLLHGLALETLVLVMDGSGVGRGCCALMLHVIYKGRALPLTWIVRQCPKGHCPEAPLYTTKSQITLGTSDRVGLWVL